MTYKKSFVISSVVGALMAAAGFLVPFIEMQSRQAQSVGIIGGASIPTYRFLVHTHLSGICFLLIHLGLSLLLISAVSLIFQNGIRNSCSKKTTFLSVALSAAGAAGFYCFLILYSFAVFDEVLSNFPFRYIGSVVGGALCLLACILILVFYIRERKKLSAKGIIYDAFTVLATFIPFVFVWQFVHKILSDILFNIYN